MLIGTMPNVDVYFGTIDGGGIGPAATRITMTIDPFLTPKPGRHHLPTPQTAPSARRRRPIAGPPPLPGRPLRRSIRHDDLGTPWRTPPPADRHHLTRSMDPSHAGGRVEIATRTSLTGSASRRDQMHPHARAAQRSLSGAFSRFQARPRRSPGAPWVLGCTGTRRHAAGLIRNLRANRGKARIVPTRTSADARTFRSDVVGPVRAASSMAELRTFKPLLRCYMRLDRCVGMSLTCAPCGGKLVTSAVDDVSLLHRCSAVRRRIEVLASGNAHP
jgi:hypothetical protein